jgi:Ubiquitin-activating enzyme E1 FCCH domain
MLIVTVTVTVTKCDLFLYHTFFGHDFFYPHSVLFLFSLPPLTPSPLPLFPLHRDSAALVTVLEETRHGLQTGDKVILTEIVGMPQLNGKIRNLRMTKTGNLFLFSLIHVSLYLLSSQPILSHATWFSSSFLCPTSLIFPAHSY